MSTRAIIGLTALTGCVSAVEHHAADDAVTVGVLLPFTGERASLGPRVEPALLMARDAINDAGGIAGHPLELAVRDTHSDVELGSVAARELLDDGVVALLGPEEADLASRIAGDVAAHG